MDKSVWLAACLLAAAGCAAPAPTGSAEEAPGAGTPASAVLRSSQSWDYLVGGDIAFEVDFSPGAACDLTVFAHLEAKGAADAVGWKEYDGEWYPFYRLRAEAHVAAGPVSAQPIHDTGKGNDRWGLRTLPEEGEARKYVLLFHGVTAEPHPSLGYASIRIQSQCDGPRPYTLRYSDDAATLQLGTTEGGVAAGIYFGPQLVVDGRVSFVLPAEGEIWGLPGSGQVRFTGPTDAEVPFGRGPLGTLAPGEYDARVDLMGTYVEVPMLAVIPWKPVASFADLPWERG